VTLYNPHILSRQELIETFVARQPLLDELLDDLRRGGAQHHLLVGDRGTGKTTLLLRLAAAIEDDKQLARKAIPLRFPEEQYNVSRPSDFWMNAIDALIDALERQGDRAGTKQLESSLSELEPLDEDVRAKQALAILEGWAKQARRAVVLLIDNLDLVLDRLAASLWELREALSIDNRLVVIGGSSTFIHDTIDYQSPFYDFFRVHELGPLSEDEARRVVLSLAQRARTPRVAEVLEQDPGRFKALYALTGGTPRTLALLHTVLALDNSDRIERDLDGLLDQLTPYYKARFDDLAPQSQVIVDAVALHWHPITATECQAATRLDLNTVSAQLSRLVKNGVLAKVSLPGPGKLGFQLGERFFNIWYLMRASRRLRRRLSWFVEFLRMFYGEEDLRRRAEDLVRAAPPDTLNSPAKFLAFASAVPDDALRRRLEFRAVELLISEELAAVREVMDLEGEDVHMVPVIDRVRVLRDIRARIAKAKVHWPTGQTSGSVAELVARNPILPLAMKQGFANNLHQGHLGTVGEAFVRALRDYSSFLGAHLLNAIATGEVPSLSDVRTPAEMHQVMGLSESRLWMTTLLLIATEGEGRSLPDETLRQLLPLDPLAAEEVVIVGGVLIRQLGWDRLRHLVLLVIRQTTTAIDLAAWIVFLRRCISARRAAEALDLIIDAGIAERWAPLHEALRAAVDGNKARLDALAPEMRVAASSLFDQLQTPDPSQASDATGAATGNPRSGGRKPTTRRASPIPATKRTKQATRRRPAKQRRGHSADSSG
jgi:energy-coupling factor transporter ATP-binding protein EcfA2